jgi:hypothetical protein
MKIISLQAENIKRLTAVEITPDGALVQITGRNGQGKTSVLDSIWWAICGAKHIQSAPIRAGAQKARIRLNLGEFVVTRTFTRSKNDDEVFTTAITVENADGMRAASPQKILDELVGALSFDPLEFMRRKPDDQLEALKALVPDFDFAVHEQANKDDYAKRTDFNRAAQQLRARAGAMIVPEGAALEVVDEAALVAELEEAGRHNAGIERARNARMENEARIRGLQDARSRAAAQIKRLQDEIAAHDDAITTCQAELDAMTAIAQPVDTAAIRKRIDDARAANARVGQARDKKALEQQALEAEVASGKLTKAMQDRDAAMIAAVAAADLPVEGLSLGKDQVVFRGQPLAQASDAEQLRVAMAIAMAMNPTLRVIRVRDGSLLDDEGVKLVAAMAEEHGFQVWMERVDTSGKIGFVIEDGALKAAAVREAAE